MSPGAKPKFNFVPERQLGEEQAGTGYWHVTLSTTQTNIKGKLYQNYQLYFPKEMVNALELENKYFRFFADIEKKALGWKVIEGNTDLEAMADAKHVRVIGGGMKFGVKSLLTAMNYPLKHGDLLKLRVENYKTVLQGDISYVIMPPIETEKAQETNPQ